MPYALDTFSAHMVPEDGPHNPLFERLDAADTLHVTILFSERLTESLLDRVEAITSAWFACAPFCLAGEPAPRPLLEDETLTPTCLHLAITNITTARQPITDLHAALVRAQVGVHQIILGRLGPDKMRSTLLALMSPEASPQTPYEDPDAWWHACFDPESAPPLSEDSLELFTDENALIEDKSTTFAEHRGLPLYMPGIRICYGVGDFEFIESDRRALDVSRVFKSALDARFRGAWREPIDGTMRPAPYNLKNQRDGALDRIQKDSRVGYSCLFTARDLREFLHGNVFRYREYELMLALRDTVRSLDLEPVVCWRRFTSRYVVQLWERRSRDVRTAAA